MRDLRSWCWLLALASCGRIGFDPFEPTGDAGSGSDGGDVDAATACTMFGPWGAPQRIDELSTTQREYVGQLMPDLMTLYFTRLDQQYVARRPARGMPFDPPQLIAELGAGCCATVRDDELELFLESDRFGTWCILRATRDTTASTWNPPEMVPSLCSSPHVGAYLTPDARSLYLNTAMPPNFIGMLRVATRASTSDEFGPPGPIPNLMSAGVGGYPTLSPDALTMRYEFSSPTDIHETRRVSLTTSWFIPTAITEINSSAVDQDNWVTEDGLEIFFSSDRIASGDLDLYVASRSCTQ